jgi:hypothetical protein
VERRDTRFNKFNAEVPIPELRDAKKDVDVRTYSGQEQCFCANMALDTTAPPIQVVRNWTAGMKD